MPELALIPPLPIVVGLATMQGGYLLATGRLRTRVPASAPVPLRQRWLFAQGVVVLFLALASPLQELSERYLFTAHMVQHLLLTLAAAPLLLAGTPGWLLEGLLRATRSLGLARKAMHPLVAFGVFNLVFSLVHLPSIYELALASDLAHAAEHLLFIGTAMLMWLPVLSPAPSTLPRYPYLGQILYLFLQSVPASLVGALLVGAGTPSYPTYELAPRILGLSPLADQQLGGLLMWVGSGLFFLGATAVVFFRWASSEERANRLASPSTS